MKELTAAQTKSIINAKDRVKAAANVMIETPLELIKCILLKHETAVIEVMKELHDEKMRLQQQRDELLEALESLEKDNHTYQTRPCPTCRKITSTLGRPFGCNAKERNAAIAKVKGE